MSSFHHSIYNIAPIHDPVRLTHSSDCSCSGGPPRWSQSRTPIHARSCSPPPHCRLPPSRNPSSPSPRRRRSPSYSLRDQERDHRGRSCDSCNPLVRRKCLNPSTRGHTPGRSPDPPHRRCSPSLRRRHLPGCSRWPVGLGGIRAWPRAMVRDGKT
jgi:hypothetical protein